MDGIALLMIGVVASSAVIPRILISAIHSWIEARRLPN